MMEPRQFIRSDIAASLVAHLSILALLILYSEVHPFRAEPSETIAVDLVTPAEVENKPEPTPTPQISLPDQSEAAQPQAPTVASQPTPQTPPPSPQPEQRQASRPAPKEPAKEQALPPQAQPSSAVAPAAAGYTPPEPDLTVKYHVMLGLPAGLPAPSTAGDKPGDGIDATASTAANIDSSVIAEFRRHLRTCSRLPAEVAPSDKIMIKLRALMTPDGKLAAEPILVEASASAKGAMLVQGAIGALQACQPYTMLPKDRYGEWKVIDLVFTPQDFAG